MAKQELRDRSRLLIGAIETKSDGKQELCDRSGLLKGNYDPKSNQTRDRSGLLVGTGNILTTLL